MLSQLTDQDASYLYLETEDAPAHVGGVSLVALPDGYRGRFHDDYKALIAARLRHIPLLHRKLARLPFDIDRPFWVEDDEVDLDYHVRHETAPTPGGLADLEHLVARLHAHPLDRSRPLWEFYVIDGMASGQVAIYTKVHHAAMDGASSQALVTTMYDPGPEPRVLPPPPDDGDQHASLLGLARGVVTHFAEQCDRAARFLPDLAHAWSGYLSELTSDVAHHHRRPGSPATPRTPFNVAITNQRSYAARTLPLAAFRQLGKQTGTTINDVVLAVCSGALRGYLGDKHALPAEALTALVPVSMRGDADRHVANHNGVFLCSLASDVADPCERLLAIHRSSETERHRLDRTSKLPRVEVFLAGMGAVLHRAVEYYGHSVLASHGPAFGNLMISNVPGPRTPLYVAGARVLSMFPCSNPFHGSALNITVQSYCDRLDFGLIACRRAVPDLAALADRLAGALAELADSVARHDPTPAGAPAGAPHAAGPAAPLPALEPAAPKEGPRHAERTPTSCDAIASFPAPAVQARPAPAARQLEDPRS